MSLAVEASLVDVYIAALPMGAPVPSGVCSLRAEEIFAVSNERVRREKYFVWRLLVYALGQSLDMRGDDLAFKKEACGAWSVEGAEISHSHSGGALAVAVSRSPVGVDIERASTPRAERMAERIMTEAELFEYKQLPEEKRAVRLFEIWSAKEAIFKTKKEEAFIPREIDTLDASVKTEFVTVGGEKYVLAVATDAPEAVRIFSDIGLDWA